MSTEVAQAEVDSLTQEIRDRSETLRKLPPHIRSISRKILFFRKLLFYLSVASRSRTLVERFGVWRGGIFIVGPFFLGGGATVVTNFVTGHQVQALLSVY